MRFVIFINLDLHKLLERENATPKEFQNFYVWVRKKIVSRWTRYAFKDPSQYCKKFLKF